MQALSKMVDPCKRKHQRTNMFVLAELCTENERCKVRVRNMSAKGAMVEGDALPPLGRSLVLSRGDLSVAGEIVWAAGRRAGVKFEGQTDVQAWLPSRCHNQQDIDRIVQLEKLKPASIDQVVYRAPLMSAPLSAKKVLEVAEGIERLSDELADDPAIVANYLSKLQSLDIAAQTLRKAAGLFGS